ncbi:hypothetical protein ACVOMT_04405 [Sphingomonas panni]
MVADPRPANDSAPIRPSLFDRAVDAARRERPAPPPPTPGTPRPRSTGRHYCWPSRSSPRRC